MTEICLGFSYKQSDLRGGQEQCLVPLVKRWGWIYLYYY